MASRIAPFAPGGELAKLLRERRGGPVTESRGSTAVIALGRHDRGDDAAGLVVADILRQRSPNDITVIAAPAGVAECADVWRRHDRVFVVDALRPAHAPGAVHRFDPGRDGAPAPRCGLHDVGLADVVTGAWKRDDGGREMIVIGIEGRWFTPQAGLSPEVCDAVRNVAEQILGAADR